MGEKAPADDRDAMASKLSLALALVALLALVAAPNAGAVGVGQQRAVGQPARAAKVAQGLIAPTAVCPGQTRLDAPAQAQLQAMRCMTDFARDRAGLAGLADAEQLDLSAHGKSGDILRCDNFSHFACDREFTYWMEESGYLDTPCWRAGENLAWGVGREGSVRSIFRAWMRSPGHRQNILGDFDQIGIALQVGELAGRDGTRVWTQHFGSHCDADGPRAQ